VNHLKFSTGHFFITLSSFALSLTLFQAQARAQSQFEFETHALDLSARVAPTTAKVVAGDGVSCSGARLNGARFAFPEVVIGWKNKSPLTRLSVIVAFQNPHLAGESYVCELSAEEVKAVFALSEPTVSGGATIVSACPLQCGGLRLTNGKAAFTAPGALTVSGRYQGSGGRTYSAQVSVPVAIEVTD
jgi:hypothetical protein